MAEIKADSNGNKVVIIPDIIFKSKKNIEWSEVQKYLQTYIGEIVEISETKDIVYLGNKFPDEYSNSKYTRTLKGAYAKAKANAAQAILEIIQIATEKKITQNKKDKHNTFAEKGWYYFKTRFAIPIYENEKATEKYNIYSGRLVINHVAGKKLYLYDLVEIKKEACNLLNGKS